MNHYTYIITNLLTGKKYYGVRSCNINPVLDIDYYGSSKSLSHDISQLGKKYFKKEIDKCFDSRKTAQKYEYDYIVSHNADKSDDWYNKHTPGQDFNTSGLVVVTDGKRCFTIETSHEDYISGKLVSPNKGKPHHTKGKTWEDIGKNAIDRKKKASERAKGSNNAMFGKTHTQEWKDNHSSLMSGTGNPMYGKQQSESTKKKISDKNSKWIYLVNTTRSIVEFDSIEKMAEHFDNKLKPITLTKYCKSNKEIDFYNTPAYKMKTMTFMKELHGYKFGYKPKELDEVA